MEEKHETVLMTQKAFDDLLEYSCSLPTGTTIGKQWKAGWPYYGERIKWYLCEYVEHEDPGMVGILRKEIKICPERPKLRPKQ
jgi:hypothetical protein